MSDDALIAGRIHQTIVFDLASGSRIKISIGIFTCTLDELANTSAQKYYDYFAIRFYTDEDIFPRRFRFFYQLRPGLNFERRHFRKIYSWLKRHSRSRERFEHEDCDDFLELLEVNLERIHAEGNDLVEYYQSFTKPRDPSLER